MLGAYTRLTDAGLGCPDWPGCYGRLVLPTQVGSLANAQLQFPQTTIEPRKAWTEMVHRYAAGSLVVLVLLMGVIILIRYGRGLKDSHSFPWVMPVVLIALLIFQAALGMWTVTLKLLPVVVIGHLLGGMLIVAGLCYFRMQLSAVVGQSLPKWRLGIGLGIVLVFCQIALGGLVSSQYAGLACIGFPRCNGVWWPTLKMSLGFDVLTSVGPNYQGGVLDNEARVTIQWIHRLGALMVSSVLLLLSTGILCRVTNKAVRRAALLSVVLVMSQVVLGIVNVLYLLPLWAAVLHNGVAALLLAVLFVLFYLARGDVAYANQLKVS